MRNGFGQIHRMMLGDVKRGFLIDNAFVQSRQRRDNLNGGTRLVRTLVSQLLIDDRKNAPGVRIGDDDSSILWSESLDRRAARHQVLTIHRIANGGIDEGLGEVFLKPATYELWPGGDRHLHSVGCGV